MTSGRTWTKADTDGLSASGRTRTPPYKGVRCPGALTDGQSGQANRIKQAFDLVPMPGFVWVGGFGGRGFPLAQSGWGAAA